MKQPTLPVLSIWGRGETRSRHADTGPAASTDPQVNPNHQINNSFRHRTTVATNRRRRRIRDSSDEKRSN
jgi:hypothetical protein